VSPASDRVSGLLSSMSEWRKSRVLLAVLILCGMGERQSLLNPEGSRKGTDSDADAMRGVKPVVSFGA